MCVYLKEVIRFVLFTVLIVNIGNVDSRKNNMLRLVNDDAGIWAHLRCERCERFLNRGPIRLCERGHNICNRCRNHMSAHFSCAARSSDQRNADLEALVAVHIPLCPFETLVATNCGFSLYLPEVAPHVKDSHFRECLEGTEDSEWIQVPLSSIQYQKAIFQLGELFLLLCSVNADWLSFIVFHVGNEDCSSGYKYDLKIENGLPRISSFGSTCHHYLEDGYEVMQSGRYVSWDLKSIQSLLDRHDVTCSLKIRRPQPIECNAPIQRYEAYSSDFWPHIV